MSHSLRKNEKAGVFALICSFKSHFIRLHEYCKHYLVLPVGGIKDKYT